MKASGRIDSLGTAFRKIPSFGRRKLAEISVRTANRDLPSQRSLIDELLEREEFLLVIFDACRFDAFEDMYTDHYDGTLRKVSTTNTYTKQYQQTMWPDTYDLTYVAGGPVISDRNFDRSNLSYCPSEHFDTIVPAWDRGYKKELGVTPPEAVTEVARETDADRMIVHYFQPHAPYIGETRLRESHDHSADGTTKIETRVESLKHIYEQIETGGINDDNLEAAYYSNLERVVRAAKQLISDVDRPTVITSDHGELLGEDGRYLHGGRPHPVLCTLPWLNVSKPVGEMKTPSVQKQMNGRSSRSVEEQLRDLGYF